MRNWRLKHSIKRSWIQKYTYTIFRLENVGEIKKKLKHFIVNAKQDEECSLISDSDGVYSTFDV